MKAFSIDAADIGRSNWVELQQALAHVSELTEKLSKENSSLPHVDTHIKINSEVETRYANKEELESELSAAVERLEDFFPQLNQRVEHAQKNLDHVRTDSSGIHNTAVQTGYSQAEEAARKQYMEAVRYRDHAAVILKKAQSVLTVSQKKKFPGRKPRPQSPSKPNSPEGNEGNHAENQPEEENETDGLISLGPLTNSTGKAK
ncbi:hypothetical protein ACFL6U_12615 [Planctomycetota bacterium]